MNPTLPPRPPKWPYFLGDALLLAVACFVAATAETPLSAPALSVVFGCVALGSVLAALPYLLDFLATQREAELEFQQKLEVQNQRLLHAVETLASTSGQLKSAHEAATRAVHAADTLPYRLQEKIAEFTAQLQERDDEDKAAMAKELETLRDAEGQRLGALVGTIQSATKEFAAFEREARAALADARREATEAAPAIAAALGAATTRAEAALNQSATHAQNAIAATENRARETFASAEAIADRILERTAALRAAEQDLAAALQQKIELLHAATRDLPRARSTAEVETGAAPAAHPAPAGTEPPATSAAELAGLQLTAFPRMRRDPASPRATEAAAEDAGSTAGGAAPVTTAAATELPEPAPDAVGAEPPPKREPRRKSSTRSLGESVLPGFAEPEIVYDAEPASHSAPAKTADGATRLLVTAYIGIGNKVFIRGEGPGLSWQKGVPMEFVSIGKWSWEAPTATEPLKVQLLKNDDLAAQGEPITIPPGHHVESTPVFREPDPF